MTDRLDLDTEWMERAACNGVGPVPFFDDHRHDFASARALCEACPVRAECLAEALATPGQQWGFRGGLTQDERRLLVRGRVLPPINHGTTGGYRAHLRRGESACDRCGAAHAERRAQLRRKGAA